MADCVYCTSANIITFPNNWTTAKILKKINSWGEKKFCVTAIKRLRRILAVPFQHPPLRLPNQKCAQQPWARQLQQPILTTPRTFYFKSAERHHLPWPSSAPVLDLKTKLPRIVTTTGSVRHIPPPAPPTHHHHHLPPRGRSSASPFLHTPRI